MSRAFLSRIALRRDLPVQAVARLLVPEETGRQFAAAHHLLWSLFADTPDRERDFLWRQVEAGRFMALSIRKPVDAHGLFEIETRPFQPDLTEGDRLSFILRANATVDRKSANATRSKRHDIVMDALHPIAPGEARQVARDEAMGKAATEWLERQGTRAGFALAAPVEVGGYEKLNLDRTGGRGKARFGVLDMSGEIRVQAPERLVPALLGGFGRARAFGCGLMLIRRAG
mgnify:CR=1 FL=1